MKTQSLSQVQLFVTKRPRLEKNIEKIYADSQDADTVIQYIVAVLVRHSLCISDFSLFCQDLVREILLLAEPTEVLRKLAPLFRDCFDSGKEWETVTRRLYKKTKIYHRYNNRISECKKYLFAKTTPVEELDGQQYKLVSTFEDAVGKIHTWSLRDADKNGSAMKINAVLELLSSLTIFERDGIRRFVKLENSEIDNCTRHIKIRNGEIVEESAQISTNQEKIETAENSSMRLSSEIAKLSEAERLELVKMLLPEGVVLADTRLVEPAIVMSEKESSNDGIIALKTSESTTQEVGSTDEKVSSSSKESSTISEGNTNPATGKKNKKGQDSSNYSSKRKKKRGKNKR